jgi:hypothetical protein
LTKRRVKPLRINFGLMYGIRLALSRCDHRQLIGLQALTTNAQKMPCDKEVRQCKLPMLLRTNYFAQGAIVLRRKR